MPSSASTLSWPALAPLAIPAPPPTHRKPLPQAFNLINLIIDRLGPSIKPYAPGLLQLLPAVWERAEGQSLLRIQVGGRAGGGWGGWGRMGGQLLGFRSPFRAVTVRCW